MTDNNKDFMQQLMNREAKEELDVSPEVDRDTAADLDEGLSVLTEISSDLALDIPAKTIQRFAEQGIQLQWIRVKIGGQDDVDNIKQMTGRGWVFVKASEVPELSGVNVPEFAKDVDRDRESEYVIRKDCALAKNLTANVKLATERNTEAINAMEKAVRKDMKQSGLDSSESSMTVGTGTNALFGGN